METAAPTNAPGRRNNQPVLVPATTQENTTSNHVTTEVTIRSAQVVTNEDIATNVAKRQRTEADDNVSEMTKSCLDEDLPDADPFVTASYKKQQRQGIPVVFRSRNVLACKPECIGYIGITRDTGKTVGRPHYKRRQRSRSGCITRNSEQVIDDCYFNGNIRGAKSPCFLFEKAWSHQAHPPGV
ncbi:hypothetical protein HPB50_022125 [Hyalomma asiaticum]|uniref:Uncharacterized protein n=1 Tax=Hyalomma asiaticum TaxID=266040 RepID=A0ACB7TK54_HYAAI|nr:hypothetical protein HPB50_022125 [Hyalomma asiaticum]